MVAKIMYEILASLHNPTDYRLSGTRIVDHLKNIDVGCNLKQFDVERPKEMHFSFSVEGKCRRK